MNLIKDAKYAFKLSVDFTLATPLLLRSGQTGDATDSAIERAPEKDGKEQLHINGYVWAGLLRRSLARMEEGKALAAQIGKYQEQGGVSPLWCEPTFAPLHSTAVNPGIAIDRKWGATKTGALYNDELAVAGLPLTMNATLFAASPEEAEARQTLILKALKVVAEGMENIGGGWTYGYGRLHVQSARFARLDLTKPQERKLLWQREGISWDSMVSGDSLPAVTSGGMVFHVRAKVADSQLLAVKTGVFPLDAPKFGKLPDSFVFRRNIWNGQKEKNEQLPVIPGKAIRQALFSVPIERKLRSILKDGESEICLSTTHGKQHPPEKRCKCKRCTWFGSTDAAGIIAVTDAEVKNFDTEVINRVQICEHSMQNMNLFSGEYLTRGEFSFKVIIDANRKDKDTASLVEEIEALLEEMKGEKAPPGWHRLGGTSTCTGQVQVIDYTRSGGTTP